MMSYLSMLATTSGMLPGRSGFSQTPPRMPNATSGIEETIDHAAEPSPGVDALPPVSSPVGIDLQTFTPAQSQPVTGTAPGQVESTPIDGFGPETSATHGNPVIVPQVSTSPRSVESADSGVAPVPNSVSRRGADPAPPPRPSFDIVRAWVAAGPNQTASSLPDISGDDVAISRSEPGRTDEPGFGQQVTSGSMETFERYDQMAPVGRDTRNQSVFIPEQQVTVSIGSIELTVEAPQPVSPPPVWQRPPAAPARSSVDDVARRLRRRYVNLGEPY